MKIHNNTLNLNHGITIVNNRDRNYTQLIMTQKKCVFLEQKDK